MRHEILNGGGEDAHVGVGDHIWLKCPINECEGQVIDVDRRPDYYRITIDVPILRPDQIGEVFEVVDIVDTGEDQLG